MKERMLHTPDGVRDLYGEELEQKMRMMAMIRKTQKDAGYHAIETPTFEYFDVFGNEVGTTTSRELFKFFDHDGNTLVLRPDFTPSIARAVSMYYEGEKRPVRLRYEGHVFVNSNEYQGRLKEQTQMGVELIGKGDAGSDAEVIALTLRSLEKAGLRDVMVSIGEVGFFKSLTDSAGLSEEEVEEIRVKILRKNFYAIDDLLKEKKISAKRRAALTNLPQLFGGAEILKEAEKYALNERAKASVRRLMDIDRILAKEGLSGRISYDFGMLSKYRYYTGIIFYAYTYGSGEAVAKGGRYDGLLRHFGTDEPSVGSVIMIDQVQFCRKWKRRKMR